MRSMSIFKRLIWKETRESLLVISIGSIAPAIIRVLIEASRHRPEPRMYVPEWTFVVLLLVTVMGVYLWGAEKANAKRGRNDFEDAYLVLPKSVDWLVSYLFPALISFAIGAWLGFAMSTVPSWSQSHWSHSQQWTVLTTGLCLLSGFCMCYAASRAFGFLPGVIVGMVWMWYPGISLATQGVSSAADPGPGLVAFMVRGTVTAMLGSIFLTAAFRVKPNPRLQAVPLILAAVVCYGPNLGDKLTPLKGIEPRYINYTILSKSSPDGSLVIGPTGDRSRMSASLRLTSFRAGASYVRSFHQAVQPVWLTDRVAYLAQQNIGEDHVRILAWNAITNKVRCITKMHVSKDAILGCQSGTASQDGRFLIFFLGAAIGTGHDFWVLDTASGRHRLLSPYMSSECPQVRWIGNRAILSYGSKTMHIRLADLELRLVDIPNLSEVQR